MKAFLLAAGRGTRLRPITDRVPKCLVDIDGRPLLAIWLELLERHGVREVLINLHHLPRQVEEFLRSWTSGITVRTVLEDSLLGSGGTLRANRGFVAGEQEFVVAYADNLTDLDLSRMVAFHRERGASFTMGLFRTDRPRECGIVELSDDGRVASFVEKPERPRSRLANAGVYIASPELWRHVPDREVSDLGFDVLPALVGTMHGYPIDEYLQDVGTVERLEEARRAWARRRERSPASPDPSAGEGSRE